MIAKIKYFKNLLGYIYANIKYIVGSAQYERPLTSIAYVLSESFNCILGIFCAAMVGWPLTLLGRGSRIVGSKGISVGRGSFLKRHAWIEAVFSYNKQTFSPVIKIGERFYASDRLHISAINNIKIGDNCLLGSGVYISDHNHGAYKGHEQSDPFEHPVDRKLVSFGPVIIGSNVWVGDNVVIIGPAKIGNGVIIGANSVVSDDIPDFVMVAGAPIRFLKIYNSTKKQWEKYLDKDI